VVSLKQIRAAKKNIKKAQRVWDRMHYSRAEGKAPEKLASDGEIFRLVSKHKTQSSAIKKADSIRKKGYKARVSYLDVGGKRVYLVYRGGRRKKTVRVMAGRGPKGHYHRGYVKKAPRWGGYGKREKPGRGKNR